jgi:hypothetical protein
LKFGLLADGETSETSIFNSEFFGLTGRIFMLIHPGQ